MLNIGLIGKTENLESHVKKIRKNPNVNIIGKASIGTNDSLKSFHYTIPEINRTELIERADIIFTDNSSKYPFELLCDIIKKSKHIFTFEYINLTIDECIQLIKLSTESGSVVQVTNPFYFTNAVQWFSQNLITPSYIDVSYISSEITTNSTLISLLMMLLGVARKNPKKIEVVAFSSQQADSNFNNIRLEYDDASVINLNYGNMPLSNKFIIKVYSPSRFVVLNFTNETYLNNNNHFTVDTIYAVDELDYFVNTVMKKNKPLSSMEDYLAVLNMVQKITQKISQFLF